MTEHGSRWPGMKGDHRLITEADGPCLLDHPYELSSSFMPGEVAWEIDGRQEVYWQGRVETWETHQISRAHTPTY